MRYLSVCSGIEAATVAWHHMGWTPLAFSEIEKFPRAVLAHHYPTVPLHGDFTKLRDEEWIAAADVLVGGTPCQAFSVAGKRLSLADDRGNLSLEFVRLADAIDHLRRARGAKPGIVLWENVPGVLNVKDNAFGCFLGALAGSDEPLLPPRGRWTNAGLVVGPERRCAWRVLDAQYFGVAQRRRRVFVVASARDDIHPAEVLFEREGVRRHSPPRREAREKPAPTISARPTGGGGLGTDFDLDGGADTCDRKPSYCTHAQGVNTTCDEGQTMIAHSLRGEGFDASEDGTGRGTPLVPVAFHPTQDPISSTDGSTHTLGCGSKGGTATVAVAFDTTQITSAANRSNPKPGDPCHPLAAAAHPPCIAFSAKDHGADAGDIAPTLRAMGHGASHANGGGQVAVAFQSKQSATAQAPSFDDVAPTLDVAKAGGMATLTTRAVRRLTPRECERLQGFPDDYTRISEKAADGPRYKALGNSMAVPVMRWIGQRINKEAAR
jgi:DNA (cytosine-5)-methyltransferase 1